MSDYHQHQYVDQFQQPYLKRRTDTERIDYLLSMIATLMAKQGVLERDVEYLKNKVRQLGGK